MKRIVVGLLLLLMMSSACFGAVSDDLYVRKDLFEAHMQSINTKLDMMLEQMKEFREEQKAQRKDINELAKAVSVLSERVDRNFETLSARINGLDKRIDDLDKRIDGVDKRVESVDKRMDTMSNWIYLWLVALGLFVSWPKVKETAQKWSKSTPSITLDDVRRLIEENNVKMAGKAQA